MLLEKVQVAQRVAQTTQFAMGTVMAHKAFSTHAEESLTAVKREVDWIESLFSRFVPGSDIWRINQSAGIQPEKLSHATFEVLSRAAAFSRTCPGCFDVTIEPLVSLWSTSKETGEPPDDAGIHQALSLVNSEDLILDPWGITAQMRYPGQSVDLGGIGKGFAGDRVVEVYRRFGVTSAYSNLGGNVVTLGAKPDGSPWQVGIQHPRHPDRLIGVVGVIGESVVTSGDYQRFFTDRHGIRRHHILNPATGYPAESGLVSVSVVAEKSIDADALSTILFVSGLERGLECLKRFPQAEAIFVDANLSVSITPGLSNRFQVDDGISVTILN